MSETRSERLPVYVVGSDVPEESQLAALARTFLGGAWPGYSARDDDAKTVLRSGTQVIESSRASGSIWAADTAELWNPTRRPRLRRDRSARVVAADVVRRLVGGDRGTDALRGQPLRLRPRTAIAGTRISLWSRGMRTGRPAVLDRQVTYDYLVAPARKRGRALGPLPLVGGGGAARVTVGDGGRPIALSHTWRRIGGVAGTARVRRPEEVIEEYAARLVPRGARKSDVTIRARLAYYSAPPGIAQSLLFPVWVLTPVRRSGGRPYPSRGFVVSADSDWAFAWAQLLHSRCALRSACCPPRRPPEWSVGASWYELGRDNEGGFIDRAAAGGARIQYNWDQDHTTRDLWVGDSLNGVDSADLAYHVGHAEDWWWRVGEAGGSNQVSILDIGPCPAAPPRWGSRNLKWMVIAGCGPLQDPLFGVGDTSAVERWARPSKDGGAFQGMHALLGYGSASDDSPWEGAKFLDYALGGETLLWSWFRAAQDVQGGSSGGTRWVAGLFAVGPNGSAVHDHLPGRGSVCPNPHPATEYLLIGTPT